MQTSRTLLRQPRMRPQPQLSYGRTFAPKTPRPIGPVVRTELDRTSSLAAVHGGVLRLLDALFLKLIPRTTMPRARTEAPTASQNRDPPVICAQSAKHKRGRIRIRPAPCKNQSAPRRHNTEPLKANANRFIATTPQRCAPRSRCKVQHGRGLYLPSLVRAAHSRAIVGMSADDTNARRFLDSPGSSPLPYI